MEENQIKLLATLAKKIKSEEKDRTKVLASLQSAKILTKGGNFTCLFKNLHKVFAIAK